MTTPAKDIQLSKQALNLLKRVSHNEPINWKKEERTPGYKTLVYYSLICHQLSSSSGMITEKGLQVLLCHEEKKASILHDWKVAIFSTVAGAFFSEPLWDALHFLFRLFSENLS